jgi:hypothetical protein
MSKVTLTFEVDEDVRAILADAARVTGRDVAQLLRDLAEDYAHHQQVLINEPDWLAQEIEEGLQEADAPTLSGSCTKMLRRTCSISARNYLGGSPSKSVIGESDLAGDALTQRDANIAHVAQEDARAALRQLDD